MSHKRITICGAFGGVNIGDEAIAQTMQAQVARLAPDARIGLLCFVKDSVLAETGYAPDGVDVISRQNWRTIWRWLGEGPIVIGGGQMLNGAKRPKGLGFLIIIAAMACLRRQPVMILGVGTRAIDQFAAARWCIRRLAQMASVFRVRDAQSLAAVRACGVPAHRVEQTADVVFSDVLPPASPEAEARAPVTCFAIHQSPLVTHYTPATYAQFVRQIAKLNPAHPIAFVCHDARPGYDLDFANAVTAELGDDLPVQILCPPDVASAMALYRTAHLVVSSRMHPLILALLAGAPVLPVEGSPKVTDLAKLFGALGPVTVSAPAADLPAALQLASQTDGGRVLQGIPKNVKTAAQANFEGLAPLLTPS